MMYLYQKRWCLVVAVFFFPIILGTHHHQIFLPDLGSNVFPNARPTVSMPSSAKELTVCFWSQLIKTGALYPTIFSYSTSRNPDEILINFDRISGNIDMSLWMVESHVFAEALPVEHGRWFHSCVLWSSYVSEISIFVNGKKILNAIGINTERHIELGGIVILGNDEVTVGGGFQYIKQFSGGISELHVWDRNLNAHEVASLANCSFPEEGNVISWSSTWMNLYNGAQIGPVSLPCHGDTKYKLHDSITKTEKTMVSI